METVTVSPKFQVVIPKAIRDELRIKVGQKVQAIAYRGRIELIPIRDVRELRGSLKGMDASDPREGLPMADAMIYATARANDATLWTQDIHFQGKPKVEYRAAAPK